MVIGKGVMYGYANICILHLFFVLLRRRYNWKELSMIPLAELSKIICKDIMLVPNQAVLYQIIIKFACSGLQPDYGCIHTDTLIDQMKEYLRCCYYERDVSEFENFHQMVYSILMEYPCEREEFLGSGKMELLKRGRINAIRPNINKVIQGIRSFPRYWVKEYKQNREHKERMVERIFWSFQYIGVYYEGNLVKNDKITHTEEFCNYYKISEEVVRKSTKVVQDYMYRVFSCDNNMYEPECYVYTGNYEIHGGRLSELYL